MLQMSVLNKVNQNLVKKNKSLQGNIPVSIIATSGVDVRCHSTGGDPQRSWCSRGPSD